MKSNSSARSRAKRARVSSPCALPRSVAFALAFALAAFACATVPVRASDHAADDALGRKVYVGLVDQGQIVDDSPYAPVLQRVGKRVAAAAGKQWYTERFYIVRGNQINAFSAPGGFVFVNEGLLRNVDNVDELAAVLGHETAHLVLGHVSARNDIQKKADFAERLGKVFVHTQHDQDEYNAATGAAHYGFLNFSRDQEYAADVKGADLAAKAGYNPWGAVWFFESVAHLDGDAGYEQYLQHHPSNDDRIAHIERHFAADPRFFNRYPKVATTMGGLPVSGNL